MAFLSNLTTITSIPLRSFDSVLYVNKYRLMESIRGWFEEESKKEEIESKRKDIFTLQMIECDGYIYPHPSPGVIVRGVVTNPLLNDFECFHLLYSFFQHLLVDCGQEKIVWSFDGMTHIINRK